MRLRSSGASLVNGKVFCCSGAAGVVGAGHAGVAVFDWRRLIHKHLNSRTSMPIADGGPFVRWL